jgi:hypothetical protein
MPDASGWDLRYGFYMGDGERWCRPETPLVVVRCTSLPGLAAHGDPLEVHATVTVFNITVHPHDCLTGDWEPYEMGDSAKMAMYIFRRGEHPTVLSEALQGYSSDEGEDDNADADDEGTPTKNSVRAATATAQTKATTTGTRIGSTTSPREVTA